MSRDQFLLTVGAMGGIAAFVFGWICSEAVSRWRDRRKPPPF
jgi:hypothetical protein